LIPTGINLFVLVNTRYIPIGTIYFVLIGMIYIFIIESNVFICKVTGQKTTHCLSYAHK